MDAKEKAQVAEWSWPKAGPQDKQAYTITISKAGQRKTICAPDPLGKADDQAGPRAMRSLSRRLRSKIETLRIRNAGFRYRSRRFVCMVNDVTGKIRSSPRGRRRDSAAASEIAR